jgi:hypothetical protein
MRLAVGRRLRYDIFADAQLVYLPVFFGHQFGCPSGNPYAYPSRF